MPSLLSRLLDLIAPRSCAICQRRLAIGEEVLCASCTLHLPRTNHAESPYDNELSQLFYRKVPVERAAALFYYEPGSCVTRVVKEMKYHNHPDYGVFLGRLTLKVVLLTASAAIGSPVIPLIPFASSMLWLKPR